MARSAGAVLGAAVLAGLIAGGITSAFHLGVAEPVIERAIGLEQRARVEHGGTVTPVVSRPVQRSGLVIGLVLYGAVWGALFGVVYLLVESRRQLWAPRARGWVVAVVVGWAVAWFPFLKYPANPPGVGDSATVAYRQLLYVSFVALSAAGAIAAWVWKSRFSTPRFWAPFVLYTVWAVLLYLGMPANPDPVRIQAGLVWTFRAISLGGLVVFWLVLATSFQWLARARL